MTDFALMDEGTIMLLTPLSEDAKEWAERRIGSDNGFQPWWPVVVVERRDVSYILDGIHEAGMEVKRP